MSIFMIIWIRREDFKIHRRSEINSIIDTSSETNSFIDTSAETDSFIEYVIGVKQDKNQQMIACNCQSASRVFLCFRLSWARLKFFLEFRLSFIDVFSWLEDLYNSRNICSTCKSVNSWWLEMKFDREILCQYSLESSLRWTERMSRHWNEPVYK